MAIVVKNTFLDVEQRSYAERRRSSIPGSFKLSGFVKQPHSNTAPTFESSVFVEQPHSGTASKESESRNTIIGDEASALNDSTFQDVFDAGNPVSRTRSKSKASSCFDWEPSMRFKFDFAKAIKRSIKLLRRSELIENVQKSESSRGCLLTVQTSAAGEMQKEQVQELVQEALLDGAVPSKSIYIIGFRAPFPFIPTEFGFDFKFGAMENAKTACWFFFKKGFCRHGDQCTKQHAIWEMPTRVRIEAAPSKSLEPSVCSATRVGIQASPSNSPESSTSFDMKKEM